MSHVPVLLKEAIAGLALPPNGWCIDGTLGGGGHAEALLAAIAPVGRLLGLDTDPEAVVRARARLAGFGDRIVVEQANFIRLAEVAARHGFTTVHAVLLDLGVSAFQLEQAERGFSFQSTGPLDMRMNPEATLTAADIVNDWSQERLADLFFRYGEDPQSRRIARAIVAARPFRTTVELATTIERAVGGRRGKDRIHPATRVFQALRIEVNAELEALSAVLPQMVDLMVAGGRFAVITFHSLEDRIVKQFIQLEARDCICPAGLPECRCGHRASLRPITKKPIRPGEPEVRDNPRSRSAKLRIAERLPA